MNYVILDLEWNTAYSKSEGQFINEIIEFGAVKLNEKLKVIDEFSSFVRPQIEKKLRSRVKTLTNISNHDVENAETFDVVCEKFTKWTGDPEDVVVMSWGEMDIRALISNCKYFFDNSVIPFVSKYIDLQAYFMQMKGLPKGNQIGLSNAAAMIEVNPDDFVHHRALNDSELSAECFKAVFDEPTLKKNIVVCDSDFYKRILFKPYFVTDINDKLVDKTQFCCKCLECGEQANQIKDWSSRNNSFSALYYCKSCKIKDRVSVQFRKTYSQLNTKKSVIVIESSGSDK